MGDFVGTCVGLDYKCYGEQNKMSHIPKTSVYNISRMILTVSGTGDFVGDWVGAFVGPPNERPNAVLLAVVASQSRF